MIYNGSLRSFVFLLSAMYKVKSRWFYCKLIVTLYNLYLLNFKQFLG